MRSVSCVLWKAVWWVVLGVVVTDMICMVCEVQKYRTLLFQRTKDQKFKQQTDFCGDKDYGEFLVDPIVVHMERKKLNNHQFLQLSPLVCF